VSLSLDILR